MQMATAAAVALALAVGAAPAATAHQSAATAHQRDPATAHGPATDGTWRMDGYGTVVSIRGGT